MDTRLRETLARITPQDIISAIRYGNRGGRDDDIFLIVRGGNAYESHQHGALDVTLVGEDWLPSMLTRLDPIVTEPILTGDALFGEPIDRWITQLQATRADENTVDYLLFHARLFLEWAAQCAKEDRLPEALENVSFAAGFSAFGVYYQTHTQAVSLRRLMQAWQHPTLALLLHVRNTIKEECLNPGVMYCTFAYETASHLTYIEDKVCL